MQNSETKIIGIHNQDPLSLFIQFSVGERYYIYERNRAAKSESIKEECFEETPFFRKELNLMDEKILLGKIKFNPKIKRVLQDYIF